MSKHTPGPWRRVGPMVFFPEIKGGFDLRNCPDAEGNATLCAAAPDLLEACEAHMNALASKIRDGKDRPEYAEAIYQAQVKMSKAIAKARGEA